MVSSRPLTEIARTTVVQNHIVLQDNLNAIVKVSSQREVHVVTTTEKCPLNDSAGCKNTHWRTGVGFEDQRRCPFHDFSWTPGDRVVLLVRKFE